MYGSIPTDGVITESLMNQLPHIFGAYLSVRLFDPNVEMKVKSFREGNNSGNFGIKDDFSLSLPSSISNDRSFSRKSVAAVIVSSLPYSKKKLEKLAISEVIADEIRKGLQIDAGEKKVFLRQLSEWMVNAFVPNRSALQPIDPKYILQFDDKIGVCGIITYYNIILL